MLLKKGSNGTTHPPSRLTGLTPGILSNNSVTPDEDSHMKLLKIKMKILAYLDLEFRTVVLKLGYTLESPGEI